MPASTIEFVRDPLNPVLRNRVSTAALSALEHWKVGHGQRSYQTVSDSEDGEKLRAVLSFVEGDIRAQPDLLDACNEAGVRPLPV